MTKAEATRRLEDGQSVTFTKFVGQVRSLGQPLFLGLESGPHLLIGVSGKCCSHFSNLPQRRMAETLEINFPEATWAFIGTELCFQLALYSQ